MLETVERELLTPVGLRPLRPLSPRHPDYKRNYHNDLLTRDAAYHQGTVWSWLVGPYIDGRLKTRPDDVAGARRALDGLDGLIEHLGENCIGQISEVFDAETPYTPGGCVAQAWVSPSCCVACCSRPDLRPLPLIDSGGRDRPEVER